MLIPEVVLSPKLKMLKARDKLEPNGRTDGRANIVLGLLELLSACWGIGVYCYLSGSSM